MNLTRAARDPWVWGQLLLFLAVFAGIPVLQHTLPSDTAPGSWLTPASLPMRLGSLLPFAAGLAILIWGFRSLGPNLTPATEPLQEGVMVEQGAYRMVRHPIYLGLILLLWAAAWWYTGPGVGFLVGVGSFIYFDRKAAVEERWMTSRFPDYAAYRARIPKLVPWRRG